LPESGRGAVLAQALVVLGHPPPPALNDAGPPELLAWARAHWRIENVPLRPAIANAAP